jgi:hypothetical protein
VVVDAHPYLRALPVAARSRALAVATWLVSAALLTIKRRHAAYRVASETNFR